MKLRASLLALTLALPLAAGCASSPPPHARHATAHAAAPARQPPDVHGDPLLVLPHGAAMWTDLDAATLRGSPYFEGVLEVVRSMGADPMEYERTLGVDLVHRAERVAFGLYLPPGRTEHGGWPVVYVRGPYEREAVIRAVGASLGRNTPPVNETDEGIACVRLGDTVLTFPAPDVMMLFDRAVMHRVTARLAGATTRSVRTDTTFNDLWRRVGGESGPARVAVDLASIRAVVPVEQRMGEAASLDMLVARGEAPETVTVHAAGRATSADAAHGLRRELDNARNELSRDLGVRLLALTRLLREGIQTAEDGDVVTVDVTAQPDEARRLLRATSLLRSLTE